jgi:FdhD protein
LPGKLRAAQAAFAATGGLHASALFDAGGGLQVVREDVGRHNALDKVVGHAFFAERLPLTGTVLLVSGRVSFEIMQKALAAGIPCVAAISAPTSAAVEFARASGQALVGFLRGERMNVYAGTLGD